MMIDKGKCYRGLCAFALGVSFGVVTGLFMLLLAWANLWWGYGTTIMDQWSAIFPGYTATIGGGLIGFLWGFLEGFITGLIIALVYNLVCCCCNCKICSGYTDSSCDITKPRPKI